MDRQRPHEVDGHVVGPRELVPPELVRTSRARQQAGRASRQIKILLLPQLEKKKSIAVRAAISKMRPKKSRCTWAGWFAACVISYALGAFNGSHWALSGEPSIFRAAPGKAPEFVPWHGYAAVISAWFPFLHM